MMENNREIDFLRRVMEHVANGDTFDETLSSTIDFAVSLVNCDECISYRRKGKDLIPWIWKDSGNASEERSRLAIGDGYVTALAEYRQPIAISPDACGRFKVKRFGGWSRYPGETFVSIPLLALSKLVGAINLKHRQPRPYSFCEFKILRSIGLLLGAEIGISQLRDGNYDLTLQLETLVERGKGILQRELGLSEQEAYLVLERQSLQENRPTKEDRASDRFGRRIETGFPASGMNTA